MTLYTAIFQDPATHPPLVQVFADREAAEAFLLAHYRAVWDRSSLWGDRPETWQDICRELQMQGQLSEHEIVYTQEHEIERSD